MCCISSPSLLTFLWVKRERWKTIFKKCQAGGQSAAKQAAQKRMMIRLHTLGENDTIFWFTTGTAEEFSRTMADEAKRKTSMLLWKSEDIDVEALGRKDTGIAVFFVATYGEGDPTDNAIEFDKWLTDKDGQLEEEDAGRLAVLRVRSWQHTVRKV